MVATNVVTFREPADERLMPPQAIDAEIAILGGILLDPNALGRISDRLPDEAFYIQAHRIVYRAALALRDRQEPIDLMTVAMFLHSHDRLEAIGGKIALARFVDITISAANIEAYADLVVDKWRRRRMGSLGRKMLELQHDPETWPALYEQVEGELMRLAVDQASAQGLRPLGDIQVDMFAEIEQYATGQASPGIPTGFADIDAMTQGFQRGDLVIVAARPSMGKTSICLGFGANIAQAGLPVAVFSLEMSQRQLAYRLTSSHSQIGISHLRTGRVADHEWERLGQSICTQSDWPLYIDDTPSPSLSHILSQCRRLKAQKGDLGMVFIDYLQLMDFSNGRDDSNESQQLGKLTRKLKGMARELDTPVVVLSQLSRGVESRSDKRPVMSDLRSSGAIEQDADIVMMLYREEYYDAQTTERGIAEVIIRKNRNGPIGTAKLLFQPEISKFRNLAHV
jgi:replicative DNA helicase